MAVETEHRIAQSTQKVFGVELPTSSQDHSLPDWVCASGVAKKCWELRISADKVRRETVIHFYALRYENGMVFRFDDVGSRAVEIRTSRYPQKPE